MTLKIPSSQKKWITPQHYSLKYEGNTKYLKMLNQSVNKLKYRHSLNSEILFLDEIKLGENKKSITSKLGEPFFIYNDLFLELPHTVFTYGLKSGSNKLKVEVHFINNLFALGTVYFFSPHLDLVQINSIIMNKYDLDDFHLCRDIIADKNNNILSFQIEPSYLIINLHTHSLRNIPI